MKATTGWFFCLVINVKKAPSIESDSMEGATHLPADLVKCRSKSSVTQRILALAFSELFTTPAQERRVQSPHRQCALSARQAECTAYFIA